MEEKKLQFTPNIPTSRPAPVREPVKKQNDRPQRKLKKKTVDPGEAVASGPFALGPAKRSVKPSKSGGGSSSTAVKVKLESSVLGEEKTFLDSDEDTEELDIDFDASDPNIPCNISRSVVDNDQMQVDDQKDGLALFQVPDILTSLISSSTAVSSNQSDMVDVKQEEMHANSDCKKGRIGTLFIDESGRMELKIGNWSFDLSKAPNCQSLQKLVVVEGKSATDLGKVSQRMICTPKIDNCQI